MSQYHIYIYINLHHVCVSLFFTLLLCELFLILKAYEFLIKPGFVSLCFVVVIRLEIDDLQLNKLHFNI